MKDMFKLEGVSLTDVEMSIYQYIRKNLELIPYMRIRELAEKAHVSPSSVLRFLKKIGYESYPEFRLAVRELIGNDKQEKLFSQVHFDSLNQKNFNQDLDYQITKVSQEMLEMDMLVFSGMGSSGTMGEYAARKLANLGMNAIAVNDPTYPVASHLNRKNGKSMLLVLSTSGETSEMVEMLLTLGDSPNVRKICITGNVQGNIPKLCDYTIDYLLNQERLNIHYDLTSQIPTVFILELLIQKIRELIS